MFQKASRIKLRFDTPKGLLTVEDLWDLPLTSTSGKANLDDLARDLYLQNKESEQISFVKEAKADSSSVLAFDIVKAIIDIRKAENESAAKARANAEKRQEILSLIKQKEGESLAGQSLEDLRKLAEQLQG